MIPLGTIVTVLVVLILLSGLRIAREYQRAVVFRLGRYTGLRGPGLFWLIPLGIENETRIDLRFRRPCRLTPRKAGHTEAAKVVQKFAAETRFSALVGRLAILEAVAKAALEAVHRGLGQAAAMVAD